MDDWLKCENLEQELVDFLRVKCKCEYTSLISIYKEFIFVRPHEIDAALNQLENNHKIEKSFDVYSTKYKCV